MAPPPGPVPPRTRPVLADGVTEDSNGHEGRRQVGTKDKGGNKDNKKVARRSLKEKRAAKKQKAAQTDRSGR